MIRMETIQYVKLPVPVISPLTSVNSPSDPLRVSRTAATIRTIPMMIRAKGIQIPKIARYFESSPRTVTKTMKAMIRKAAI
jgi:hypothetical protein